MPLLKRGSKGPSVVALKKRLRAHGHWKRIWGYTQGFGRITESQVKKFQKAKGLTVDGQVGPQTWAALNETSINPRGERARCVRWARACVGITENPPGSNAGPRISKWQKQAGYSGGNPGVPWCACFVGAAWQHASRNRIKASKVGGYCPSIVSQARVGQNGLRLVPLNSALPGDAVTFDFGVERYDHIGLFIKDNGNGTITTVEGNTAAGPGGGVQAQANGGGVFVRIRAKSLVSATIRPDLR